MTEVIRLDQLPPPNVVQSLDFEALLAKAKARFAQLMPDYTADVASDPVAKQLELIAYVAMLKRQQINDAARAVLLPFAKDADLDNLAAFFGVQRLEISPAQPALGIARVMEDDDALLERVLLAPASYSVAGPEDAYVFHARSASGDVLSASATSPEPGVVVVSVLSRQGDGTASQALLDTVTARVTAATVRPMTDHVLVQSARIVSYAVQGTLWTYAGPDPDIALGESRAKVGEFTAASRRLGTSITLSGLTAAAKVAGIQDVAFDTPTASLKLDKTQAGYCTGIDLRYGGLGE